MISKMEDRIKIDLASMSRLILDNLRQCDASALPHTPEMINRLAVQFNQGALLQYQYGEIERAETLCHAEIELFARLGSYSPNRALCLGNMIAPYMNLARIHGQKGEVAESLSIFEDIYRFGLRRQDLSIFGHRISVADAPAMFAATQGCQKVMLSCRVVEAARVLQTVEDYPALLALADENEGRPEYQEAFFRQYLLEVRCRSLLHTGRYEAALEALQECCRLMPLNTTDRVVAHLLLSQVYREWGRDDAARETLDKLEEHFAGLEKFGRRLPILRQLAYRLALERHLLGDDEAASDPAEKSFRWCGELSDQPGSIKAAILLLRLCAGGAFSPAAGRRWFEELRRLASATLFRLERACACWELGLSAELVESGGGRGGETACEFLQRSYNLYRSMPFVDSRRSREAVGRALDSRGLTAGAPVAGDPAEFDGSLIDSVFDALMEYAPESSVMSQ